MDSLSSVQWIKCSPKHDDPLHEKDAHVVVVETRVLVHVLHQVKKWYRHGRPEIAIVPLEALNTLDLLKKGISALTQHTILFSAPAPAPTSTTSMAKTTTSPTTASAPPADALDASPEWLRRTRPHQHDPRAAGILVSHWTARAGIALHPPVDHLSYHQDDDRSATPTSLTRTHQRRSRCSGGSPFQYRPTPFSLLIALGPLILAVAVA
ncbi:hypothetical protein DFH09DRAFT_1301775 [Mycena vulgaris]|nr:hypothetical protein DFH09DRAFT_1301775 [Mycena vulgaris]